MSSDHDTHLQIGTGPDYGAWIKATVMIAALGWFSRLIAAAAWGVINSPVFLS